MRWVIHWLKNNFSKKGNSDSIKSQKLNLADRILVLGDSHVRSYANNPNFFPVFLGQGRLHNFTSTDCAENYAEKAIRVLEEVDSDLVIFVLGEPDTRFALGLGWRPWELDDDLEKVKGFADQSSIEGSLTDSVSRISSFVDRMEKKFSARRFYVISTHPVKISKQSESICKFNEKLRGQIQDRLIDCSEYSESISKLLIDPVHHGGGIQPIVEDVLIDLKLLEKKSGCLQEDWESEKIRSLFTMNDRFGCYIPEAANLRSE